VAARSREARLIESSKNRSCYPSNMLTEEVTVGILKSPHWVTKSSENKSEVSGKYIRQEEVGGSEKPISASH